MPKRTPYTGRAFPGQSLKFVKFTPFILLAFAMMGGLNLTRTEPTDLEIEVPQNLSDYGFFQGPLTNLDPTPGVVPYDLNTPLFSDYAFKKRFIKLPPGSQASYDPEQVFDFPNGTILIKNFYYPSDFRKPDKARRMIETRLLIKEGGEWTAWPYVWNEAQTEASLEIAGDEVDVSWTDDSGKKRKIEYLVPSTNQCKGCHSNTGKMIPIGPAARHLNRLYSYPNGIQNQLSYWQDNGMLKGLPPKDKIMANAVWNSPETGTLDDRARAWMDINCGHCHSPGGAGSTSGLLLDIYQKDPLRLGINKTPVAAGRGSGDLEYDILPGQPAESILIYRLKSNDLGVKMPEIGRTIPDEEGIALITDWIREMK